MHNACTPAYGWNMPKNIQIRNVPDDVHATLRARAAKAGMSLSQYLRHDLIESAARPTVAEIIDRARSRPATGITHEDVIKAIHEGRAERDERLDGWIAERSQ